ncbi:MAG: cyanophycin synthetase [Candidatus Peribacteraceae bacterium]|nr:cyanophycin synthetase [Candidatus Peribacteraceae bacterium]
MKIFCSGIGGMGLSAYAAYQKSMGHTVLGSDRALSPVTEDLRSQGVTVFAEQDGSRVPPDADLFVFSEAVPEGSPERVRAAGLGIPSVSYFQALGDLTRGSQLIAVCGTHGKSSTTAMAVRVLLEQERDPGVIIGTKVRELHGRNWRRGAGDLFLVEACEYRRSFLHLSPQIILLNNADGDHFDYYRSPEDYESAFVEFVQQLPPDGIILTHGGDPVCARIALRSGRTVVDADRQPLPAVGTPGEHMRRNAQLVLALSEHLQLERARTLRSLAAYAGCWRRMEVRGMYGEGIPVIDDYAHHPAEIRATLQAMREAYPDRRLVVVFQPHTHDRTLKLYKEFVQAFRGAGTVIIPNIYDARRERDQGTVDLSSFVADIAQGSDVQALHGTDLPATERLLRERILQPEDALIVMGAGDVTALAGRMTKA